MTVLYELNSQSKLGELIDMLHDCWFDVDAIEYCKDKKCMMIPFDQVNGEELKFKERLLEVKERGTKRVKMELHIECVEDYRLEDTENIGKYDFNEMVYDSTDKCLSILTGVPLGLKIRVGQLSLSVTT